MNIGYRAEPARLRLANQVVLVDGTHAAALYDLSAIRIRRISAGARELLHSVLDGDGSASAPQLRQAEARRFLDGLLGAGYLEVSRLSGDAGYFHVPRPYPGWPPMRTLSFVIDHRFDEAASERMTRWLAEASSRFGLVSVLLVDRSEGGHAAARVELDVARRFPGLLRELITVGRPPATDGTRAVELSPADVVPSMRGPRRVAVAGSRMGPQFLLPAAPVYNLHHLGSESNGCLHVEGDGSVYPDIAETRFRLDAADDTVAGVMRAAATRKYWSTGKDLRDKCQGCELRYACLNPLAARSLPDQLRSAPANCGYSLPTGTWH